MGSIAPYPLTPITGPFGGGSDKAGFIEGSNFANDTISANANEGDWLLLTASGGSAALLRGQMVVTTASSNDAGITRHAANYSQETNYDMFLEARVASSDVDKNDLWLGWYIAAITNIIPDLSNVDGIGFVADGDDGKLDFLTGSNSGTGTRTSDVLAMTDGKFFTIGIKVLGTNAVEAYVNGQIVARHTAKITPSADLRPVFNLDAIGSTTDTLSLDWFRGSWQQSDSL